MTMKNEKSVRIAVFASGNGSNFETIVQAALSGRIDARVVLLVCDKPGAFVNERAARLGVETFAFRPKDYVSKEAFEWEIARLLDEHEVDLVCLAGYMRIIGPTLLGRYGGKIINIHPSLLPAFRGAHAIEQAFEYGVKVYGVSIHYVDDTLDGGKIIAQKAFEYYGDDIREVESMIHAIEHELYIDTVNKLIREKKQ